MRRYEVTVGASLQHHRVRLGLPSMELAIGFPGSRVDVVVLEASANTLRARLRPGPLDTLLDEGWEALEDPRAPGEGLPIGAIRTEGAFDVSEVATLGFEIHATRIDHLAAVLADPPVEGSGGSVSRRSIKSWLYDILDILPGIVGADHSATLLLPDRLSAPSGSNQYVIAAERLFVAPGGDERPEHLIGLLIPCEDGKGGLLEAALELQRAEPELPCHIFIPERSSPDAGRQGVVWRSVGDDGGKRYRRFKASVLRDPEGVIILVPVTLPGRQPAFIGINSHAPTALSEATIEILGSLKERFGDALVCSSLFRVPTDRLDVFGVFAEAVEGEPCARRSDLIGRLTPGLREALGAASLSIGLLEDEGERLSFENPQGWDLDQPLSIPVKTVDSISALAIRMDRPIVLAGGRGLEVAPSLRWNNCAQVNERLGLIEDSRMGLRDYEGAEGWRPLSDYYRPTSSTPIYVGIALPIRLRGRSIGVIAIDFGRSAPWDAYSGFGAEGIYQALVRLVASHLALLPA